MNEKHREVQNWLEGLFGGDPVPQFEINPRTVEILHGIMRKNQQQDNAASILVEDHQQKAKEYSVETERMSNILKKIGLSPGSLSQSGTASLRNLTNVALLLDTKDASNSSLLLALSESAQVPRRIQEAHKMEQKMSSELTAKTKTGLIRANALKKALDALEERSKYQGPELEKKAKQAGFLQSKGQEYKNRIHELKNELKLSGADPALLHRTLVRKADGLKELRTKLHPIRAKLDSYQELPPDLELARVKVEEAKRDLGLMEEELSQQIDLMHI